MTFDFDAVLVASYGGPRRPEDVLPFMRNATRGRDIPDERLVEVSEHYMLFGGASPINERNDELMAALRDELAARGVDVPVVIGNRNWGPYLADVLAELAAAGAKRVVVLATSAYASYSNCRQYREDLAAGLASSGVDLELVKVGPFAETDGFVTANADAVRAALAELPGARVVFVTHSIPLAMDAASGPGGDNTYSTQHRRVAQAVAAEVGLADDAWEIAYCSRSGAPHIPWLEPDINDRLTELAGEGVGAVVTVPFGFISDHMEVVYDLDTEARATASGLGLDYVRASTVGVHPAFVAMLADRLLSMGSTLPDGVPSHPEAAPPSTVGGLRTCGASCCLSGRPGTPLPAACGT